MGKIYKSRYSKSLTNLLQKYKNLFIKNYVKPLLFNNVRRTGLVSKDLLSYLRLFSELWSVRLFGTRYRSILESLELSKLRLYVTTTTRFVHPSLLNFISLL